MVGGAVLRGGWLFCSFSCARQPGASNRAWHGRLKGPSDELVLEEVVQLDRSSGLTLPLN